MNKTIYIDYFKRSALIWILLLFCIYAILACEFESLRISSLSINKDLMFVNKINSIIKNLSYSYIAGVIFFFLSDTIPFFRRKKVVYRNVKRILCTMIDAIDDFSMSINCNKWDERTDTKLVFEEFSGGEYTDNMPQIRLTSDKLVVLKKLSKNLNVGIDYLLSQELYLDVALFNEIEKLKMNETFLFISTMCEDTNENLYITAEKLLVIFDYIIEIKKSLLKNN